VEELLQAPTEPFCAHSASPSVTFQPVTIPYIMENGQIIKPDVTPTGTMNKMIQRVPSLAVTPTTLSTAGSDSRSSITVSDQDAESCGRVEEQTDERNVSTDEYFTKEFEQKVNEAARQENQKLNLNLGLPFDPSDLSRRQPIKILIRLLHRFLLLVENPLFRIWSQFIPLRLRQKLTLFAWKVYFPLHKLFLGRKTGLHPDVSLEYHALSSVMWWGRLFPVTVQRMRFSLSQLHVCHSPEMYPSWRSIVKKSSSQRPSSNLSDMKSRNGQKYCIHGHLFEVYHEMHDKRTPTGIAPNSKRFSKADMTVTGKFIQHSSRPSKKVIFWIYGGAYLAGDSEGNMGIAEKMGMTCAHDGPLKDGEMRDVFIPDYRLVPEFHLDDAIHDITLAYEWLVCERGIRPENVILLGISSGGGLAVLLMQALAESRRKSIQTGEFKDECDLMPAGAVLVGPFVDYTKPKGSMKEYIKHDLIVNQVCCVE
ncbi:hypothetical protein ACHAWX_002086, partial [Stephanocyclus meneghinianus]